MHNTTPTSEQHKQDARDFADLRFRLRKAGLNYRQFQKLLKNGLSSISPAKLEGLYSSPAPIRDLYDFVLKKARLSPDRGRPSWLTYIGDYDALVALEERAAQKDGRTNCSVPTQSFWRTGPDIVAPRKKRSDAVNWKNIVSVECHGTCGQTILKDDLARNGRGGFKPYCRECYAKQEKARVALKGAK